MATNFGPEATTVADIPSAMTPKEGVVKQPVFLQGLSDIFDIAGNMAIANKKSKNQQSVAEFTQRQLLVADALAQGKIRSSAHAQTLMRKNLLDAIDASPTLMGDLLDAQKAITGLPGGAKIVDQGTQEEQRRNSLVNTLVSNGIVAPDASEDEINAGIYEYRTAEEATRRHNMRMQTIDEKLKSNELSNSERTRLEKERKEASRQYAYNLAPIEFKRVRGEMQKILDDPNLSEADKTVALDDLFSQFKSSVTDVVGNLDSQESAALIKPFDMLYESYQKRMTGEINDAELKRENERIISIQTNLALQDPNIANLAVTSKLFGDSGVQKVLAGANSKVLGSFLRFLDGTTPGKGTPPPSPYTEDMSERKGLKEGLSAITRGVTSSDQETKDEASARLGLVLSSVEDYEGLLRKNPKAGIELVSWMASPEFLKAQKAAPEAFADLDAAREVVNRYYSDEVWTMVQNEFRDNKVRWQEPNPDKGTFTPFVPPVLNKAGATPDLIGVRSTDSGMEFYVLPNDNEQSTREAEFKVKELNKDLKPIINTTVKAMAHLSGSSNYKGTWETVSQDIMGGGLAEDTTSENNLILEDFKQLQSKFDSSMEKYADAIASVESKGSGGYAAKGPVMKSGSYSGDRAYGRYQVMGRNIPSWTEMTFGKSLTVEEFMNGTEDMSAKQIQDEVFAHIFGGYVNRYGNADDAASAWFSGRPLKNAQNASDGYITAPTYVSRFRAGLG